VPHSHLSWHHRCRNIVDELAALRPDVICLQEVDQYHDLKRELERLG
jgi:mRNA deadenylase 3'-5' endonuclease subunit Ccr4